MVPTSWLSENLLYKIPQGTHVHTKVWETVIPGKPISLAGNWFKNRHMAHLMPTRHQVLLRASPHSSERNSLFNIVWDVMPRTSATILGQPKDKAGRENTRQKSLGYRIRSTMKSVASLGVQYIFYCLGLFEFLITCSWKVSWLIGPQQTL